MVALPEADVAAWGVVEYGTSLLGHVSAAMTLDVRASGGHRVARDEISPLDSTATTR